MSTYQGSLSFDDTFAWFNLLKKVVKAAPGEEFTFYGLNKRKIKIKKLEKNKYQFTSQALLHEGSIEYEGEHRFFEVELMSTVLKDKNKHLHIYERRQTNKDFYRCVAPRCSHYIKFDLLVGKDAECPKCGSAFEIQQQQINLRNKKLVCLACSKSIKGKNFVAAKSVVEDVLDDILKGDS